MTIRPLLCTILGHRPVMVFRRYDKGAIYVRFCHRCKGVLEARISPAVDPRTPSSPRTQAGESEEGAHA